MLIITKYSNQPDEKVDQHTTPVQLHNLDMQGEILIFSIVCAIECPYRVSAQLDKQLYQICQSATKGHVFTQIPSQSVVYQNRRQLKQNCTNRNQSDWFANSYNQNKLISAAKSGILTIWKDKIQLLSTPSWFCNLSNRLWMAKKYIYISV